LIVRINDILDEVTSFNPDADCRLVEKAYVFSASVHQGQIRLSGEPYLYHPLEVALMIAQMRLDAVAVAAALLHDTVEDSLTTVADIEREFGQEVAVVVDGLTKIGKMHFRSREEHQAENYRKMILAMSKDIRVLLIKLIDRLHNMRTLEYHKRPSQIRIAQETLDIYAPLANRLGIHWLQIELQELSLKYLDPEGYATLKAKLDAITRAKEGYLESIVEQIRAKLIEIDHPDAEVSWRIKHIFSVYQKLVRQGIPLENVYDVLGVRIKMNTVAECYEMLGIIHSLWKPIQARIKDFIAMPKENFYQSLHTTVFGPEGERIEFQIRTFEMDYIANEGIAAHWRYKEGDSRIDGDGEQLAWLRQLLEWQKELSDPKEFLQSVKIDLYPDDVYVFTPQGDVKRFPLGSTPLDFAYSIHTELGHQCSGAKINGQIVPLKYKLKSGDVVTIMRAPSQHPSKDWLRIAKTSRARAKIKGWIRQQEHEQSVTLGRDILDKRIRALHLKEVDLEQLAHQQHFKTVEDLCVALAYGRVSVNQVLSPYLPEEPKKEAEKVKEAPVRRDTPGGITVRGVGNLMVRYAHCCRPIPGDEAVGFITRGRGVTVHRAGCAYIADAEAERLVPVQWDAVPAMTHEIEFSISCEDKPGMLSAITSVIGAQEVNITKMKANQLPNHTSLCVFKVMVHNLKELDELFVKLKQVKGVKRIERAQAGGQGSKG